MLNSALGRQRGRSHRPRWRFEPAADRVALRALFPEHKLAARRVVDALTPMGDDQKPWVLATAILVLARARGRRAAAAAWRALAVGAALARLLDIAVQRERPGAAAP